MTSAIKDVDATHPGAPSRAMALRDAETPVTPRVFIRGNPRTRGEVVPRRFISFLCDGAPKPFSQGSGRRELAEAITDPGNPLTARVLANRVWMRHFGEGLAPSADDFGLRAAAPTHPKLLDYLAATFIEQGYSIKKLHRLVMLSRVYQQSSRDNPANAAQDPDNRFLWRANRRRLDFESLRDALLCASGQLDPTQGGRSVSLTEQPFSTRRTVYGYIDRVNLDDMFSTFDFPSPDQPSAQRAETLVPQQALFVMNDPFMVEQARAIVAQAGFQQAEDAKARIQYLYGRLLGREALPREEEFAQRFIGDASQMVAQRGSVWHYGYGPADAVSGAAANTPAPFTKLEHWTGRVYQVSEQFPDPRLGHLRLTRVGGHPGRDIGHAVIRRWVAPVSATISIEGTLEHLRDKGDGVHGRVRAGNGGALGAWTAFNGAAETKIARYRVQRGESIDFVVDCRKTPTADAFTWAPVIRVVEGGEALARPTKTQWDARREFSSPPPPMLTAWEQYAQALLLTNEFMYLD